MLKEHRLPVKRIACYVLVLLAVFLVGAAPVPLEIQGYRIDLLGCVTAAISLMEGPYLGMAFGILTGLFYDIGRSGVEGFYPMYYMLFGIAAGIFANRFLRRIFPSMLLLTAAAVIGVDLFRLFGLVLLQQRFDLLYYAQSSCGEALLTVLLSPLVYLPIRTIYHRLHQG